MNGPDPPTVPQPALSRSGAHTPQRALVETGSSARPRAAKRLVLRLAGIQVGVGILAAFIVVSFAPRLLLLDDVIVAGSLPVIAGGTLASCAFVVASTAWLTRETRPTLKRLALGAGIDPRQVLDLYGLPARLVIADLLGVGAITAATMVRPLRPATNDVYTQLELVVLVVTIVSVAALPCFVTMRASVARVIEIVPSDVNRDAIELLEARHIRYTATPRPPRRVRWRFLFAVAAPVAFVAIGASLLVHAHVRAYDQTSREGDALDVARGVLERLNGDTSGREAAIEEAKAFGLAVDITDGPGRVQVERDVDEAETVLTVPLAREHAVLRFDTAPLSPAIGIFLIFTLFAAAVAGALGARLGSAFSHDVALATSEVREMGASDFLHGTPMLGDARFGSVNSLVHAIDRLGVLFREFAAAQQRAIDARMATERMRGLFLASMSHDLKAPLNAILGFAELVSRSDLTEAQRESVTIIEQRGRELLHLINTILDAARVEASELVINPEWTKVGDVVMAAVMDARELAGGADVQIVGEIQPGVPRILVDPPRIAQALTAVILVAVRFAEHGMIRVRATLPAVDSGDERLRIDVEATGAALPAEERDRIFEAFKYADRARRHGSLGLGPSLARAILELHEGTIGVEATEIGAMLFRVWLPTERTATKVTTIPPWQVAPG